MKDVTKSQRKHYEAGSCIYIYSQASPYSSQLSHNLSFLDTLVADELPGIVTANRRKSLGDLALFLTDYLVKTYTTQYWVVTVYSDWRGWENHAFIGYRITYKFSHHGLNYVVTRYPKHFARSPSVSISEVVGSVNQNHAKDALDAIKSRFDARGQSFSIIHVVKWRRTEVWFLGERTLHIGLATAQYLPSNNIFSKKFSNVFVIVVAPY